MKKIVILFILSLLFFTPAAGLGNFALADGQANENYIIYNEDGEIICEKSSIEIGDGFITPDFCEYEIIQIENHKGYAKLVKKLRQPNINRKKNLAKQKLAQRGQLSKKICLYLTHNDESYTPSDGYDSIYGKGGIHDVAKEFQNQLDKKGISVVLDETLHIPHNSTAYSRSGVTAKKLLDNQRPDAMFDVHRDGVSKSFYYVTNNGEGYSKIRIVVGKSNPNFDENYSFAQTIFALGNDMYPFLFSDIYLGKGHYNQALQPTDLLFEMGTYLIEKEYVMKSLPLLANVVEKALYQSETDANGDIAVDDNQPSDEIIGVKPPISNDIIDVKPPNVDIGNGNIGGNNQVEKPSDGTFVDASKEKGDKGGLIIAITVIGVVVFGMFLLSIALIRNERKNKKN